MKSGNTRKTRGSRGLNSINKSVSVIIPVYNKEEYVFDCIKSAATQTYSGTIEIIIVDDGSTDNSIVEEQRACKKYTADNIQIKLIASENRGVAAARNIGIDEANGEYLLFLDADDLLHESCLEVCINLIEDTGFDFVEFEFYTSRISNSIETGFPYSEVKGRSAVIREFLNGKKIKPVVCGAMYRGERIIQHRFIPNLQWGEDTCFKFDIVCESGNAIVVHAPLYCNRLTSGSLSRNQVDRKVIDANIKTLRYIEKRSRECLDLSTDIRSRIDKWIFERAQTYLSLALLVGNGENLSKEISALARLCERKKKNASVIRLLAYKMSVNNKELYMKVYRLYRMIKKAHINNTF